MSTTTRPPEINSGVLTTWLPLATAWPSVSQCSTEIYSQMGVGVAIGFDPFFGLNIDPRIKCLPPAATAWWNADRQTPAQTVTSIGPIVCPELYTTAHTSVVNSLSTFVACCPSNYDFQSVVSVGSLGQCNSPLRSGQAFTFYSATPNGEWTQTTSTISINYASVFAVHMNGYIFATTSSSSSASLPTSTSSSSPTSPIGQSSSSSGPPQVTSTTNPAASSGLSSGAKAGIGVGVAFGAIGILSLIVVWFLIRKHRRKAEYTMELDAGAEPLPPKPPVAEMGYSPVAASELPVGHNHTSRYGPVELSGESR